MDVQNADLLPISSIEAQIYNVGSPGAYSLTWPLGVPSQSEYVSASMAGPLPEGFIGVVSFGASGNWGFGYSASRYGYGYGFQTGAWGYQYYPSGYGYGYTQNGYGYNGPTSMGWQFVWVPPTSWPSGNYGIRVLVYGDNSDTPLTNPNVPTFTLIQTGNSGPTGNFGGNSISLPKPTITSDPATHSITVGLGGVVDNRGAFVQAVTANSFDNAVQVKIDAGVTGLTMDGLPLSQITLAPLAIPPAPPAQADIIGLIYNFGPDGATFSPPITLTFSYDPASLATGVDRQTLVLAYYDSNAGRWTNLTGVVVDTVNHTISGKTSHFTPFGVIAKAAPAAQSTPVPAIFETPRPVPTLPPGLSSPLPPTNTSPSPTLATPAANRSPTATPAATVPPTVIATTHAASSGSNAVRVIEIIAAVFVIGVIVTVVIRRKK